MDFPPFVKALPPVRLQAPPEVVTTHAAAAPDALVVWFEVHQDIALPEHAHGPQWGMCLAGELEVTIDGVATRHGPGGSWSIPDGAPHSARIKAGARLMEVFAEPDRYEVVRPDAG